MGEAIEAAIDDGETWLEGAKWHLVLVAILAVPAALAIVDWIVWGSFEASPLHLALPAVILAVVVVVAMVFRGRSVRALTLGQQAVIVVGATVLGLGLGLLMLVWFHLKIALFFLRGLVRFILHGGGPQVGQIWWADVPYDGGTDDQGRNRKERPVLVLKMRGTLRPRYVVAQFTSQSKRRGQPGYLEVPAVTASKGASFLNTRDPKVLKKRDFVRSAEDTVPKQVRRQILQTARSGFATGYRL